MKGKERKRKGELKEKKGKEREVRIHTVLLATICVTEVVASLYVMSNAPTIIPPEIKLLLTIQPPLLMIYG
jgi:hypothetical protein